MSTTTDLGLKKPTRDEFFNIADLTDNLDILNELLKARIEKNKVINNFTTTEEGFVADARALKSLYEEIDKLQLTLNGRDLDNANTLEGFSRLAFLQHYTYGNGVDVTSPTITQPYSANINEPIAQSIGLENAWWHLIYFPHDIYGYGIQIAFALNTNAHRPKYRIAFENNWQPWRFLNDNTYVQATAPANPICGDLWIW
jgi:hypothetical protein